jgi:hypothetical protein
MRGVKGLGWAASFKRAPGRLPGGGPTTPESTHGTGAISNEGPIGGTFRNGRIGHEKNGTEIPKMFLVVSTVGFCNCWRRCPDNEKGDQDR